MHFGFSMCYNLFTLTNTEVDVDVEKTLKAAMLLRESAGFLIAQAEQLELEVKLARAKELPNGDLIALLIKAGHLKKRESKGH